MATSCRLSTSSAQFRPGVPFPTPWERPVPPILPSGPHELHWLYPEIHTGLIWDSSMGTGDGNEHSHPDVLEVRGLMARAIRAPLLPAQQQLVHEALEHNPRLASSLLEDSSQLPSLVEHCPAIASALLMKLFQQRSAFLQTSDTCLNLSGQADQLASEMLGILAHSDVSLHGMEVVNKLTSTVDLPGWFSTLLYDL